MTTNYPKEDPTAQLPAATPVNTPGSTVAWRARTVVEDVYRLLTQIASFPRSEPAVSQWAAMIKEQADQLTAGGKVAESSLPELEEHRETLTGLLRQLTGRVQHLPGHAVADLGPVVQSAADTWDLPRLIRQERQCLPKVSRWPWLDGDARRRVRAWKRVYRRLVTEPVDQPAVVSAWQAYLKLIAGPARAQITNGPSSP
jgi:hypothetical protein